MTRGEFKRLVIGKRITGVTLAKKDCFGHPLVLGDEIVIEALELDDGKFITFSGSPQIGVDDVWADLED